MSTGRPLRAGPASLAGLSSCDADPRQRTGMPGKDGGSRAESVSGSVSVEPGVYEQGRVEENPGGRGVGGSGEEGGDGGKLRERAGDSGAQVSRGLLS